MPGWQDGCTKEINGTAYSNQYSLVENSPHLDEYSLFEANGIMPSLEKLINLKTEKMKDYKMELYQQRNLEVSNHPKVTHFMGIGLLVDFWIWIVKHTAEWCFYLHAIRVLVDFIYSEGACGGCFYTIPKALVCFLIYVDIVLLIFSLGRVQHFNLDASNVETSNHVLQFTLN